MFKKIKAAILILKYGKSGESIDFRSMEKKGISRSEWDAGITLLKRFNIVELRKNKTILVK